MPGSAVAPIWTDLQAWLRKGGPASSFGRRARPWASASVADEAGALLGAKSLEAIARASLEVLAVAERVVMEHCLVTSAPEMSLLAWIAASRGLADAVRVYLGACALDGADEMHHAPPAPLRVAAVLASETSYTAGRAVAETARPTLTLQRRSHLAYAFPDESWATEDLETWLADPAYAADHVDVGPLLTATVDADVVARFLATPHGHHALAPAAFDLAAVMPPERALPLFERGLERLLEKPKYGAVLKTPPRHVAEAVGSIGTPESARLLARFATHPILSTQILAFFRDHPDHTAALQASAGTGTKLAATAQRIVTKQARVVATAAVAQESELPSILRTRPWTQKPERPEVVAGVVRKGMELERLDEALVATLEIEPGSPAKALKRQGTEAIARWVRRDWTRDLPWEGGEQVMRAASAIVSPALAPQMARVLSERKQFRHHARAWLMGHSYVAAVGLVPEAVGENAPLRRSAEVALLLLATHGERATVQRAAALYGNEVERVIDALLARDPRRTHRSVPKRPAFLKRKDLHAIRLRGRETVLGSEAIESVLDMLSLSLAEEPYAGLAELSASLDESSWGAFALELLEQWVLADAPGRHEWMGFAVLHARTEAAEARLVALAREWSAKNLAKCERACIALAALGTDRALLQLSRIAATTRFAALRERAAMLLGEVAVTRGLTPEELEDRTVPDLDAVEARERERLRSEVSRRLETLLVAGRTVSADDFGGLFARHATVGPMARRLVWETDDGSAQFRIAEDGSYASLDHDAVALPPSSRIRLAHPARGGSWVAAWATHFAELEVIQPFEQLGRQVHVPTKAQGRERAFEVEAKRPVPAKKLLGLLESRGWRRDDRAHPTAFHRDHGETRAVLAITPGFEVHDVASAKAQSLRPLRFTKTRSASDARDLALGEVDAVVFSEAVRDAMAASALA